MKAVQEYRVGSTFDPMIQTTLRDVGSYRLLDSLREELLGILHGGKLPKAASYDGFISSLRILFSSIHARKVPFLYGSPFYD